MSRQRGEVPHAGAPVVLALQDVDRSQVGAAGGKAVQLGELPRLDGVSVPAGFCVTTHAFERFIEQAPALDERLESLWRLDPEDGQAIRASSAEIRDVVERLAIPDGIAGPIIEAVVRLGEGVAYAVRSSATAEDSPTASFAGQHDTFLNVPAPAVLDHVRRCWASLFTERAAIYRQRIRVDHRDAHMAVVVQQMVSADSAGTMFTADPVTSDRRVVAVEAAFGLGEAVVSGLVNTDRYRVRAGEIIERTIAAKRSAVATSPGGGTHERPIAIDRQTLPALTDEQVLLLAVLGRRIEAHFGQPQDIEWCLAGDTFEILQSRPITTLFPIPAAEDDGSHVYISVGHQQMMTDAMKPLGLSVWQLTTRAPMRDAGGRLFVDVTRALSSPASRTGLLEMVGRSDPLIRDALERVIERGDFLPPPDDRVADVAPPAAGADPIDADPAIVTGLIARTVASLEELRSEIGTKSGPALFDFILADLLELQQRLFDPDSRQVVMAAFEATWWLDDHMEEWLGERGAVDTLARSAPNNVTSEMGLALLDVADQIRPHREAVAFLEQVASRDRVDGGAFLDELSRVSGGEEAQSAITRFLDAYGMRCVGEIDITRPRWAERPSTLVPLILGTVTNFGVGAAQRRFEQGQRDAATCERELLERLRDLPDGASKVAATKEMIDRLRTFIGYREYPKYGMVCRYFIYKRALLREAERLVTAGVLGEPGDIYYLTFHELHDAVRTDHADRELVDQRRRMHAVNERLTPPRVLTSDGEAVTGAYRRDDVPPGALVGLPVSAGVVEGRARIVSDMADADLEPGDILVTTHTDPSWSPLFVTVAGLVTEVGGRTTHGAVVAREYGLPAVVGVADATSLILDGQHIRIDGTNGYIQILASVLPPTIGRNG